MELLINIELETGGLTPGITRRAFNYERGKFSMTFSLIRGQVHAIVRRRLSEHTPMEKASSHYSHTKRKPVTLA